MLEEGFAIAAVEQALEATWAQRGLYVADSDDEALQVAAVALSRYRHHLDEARRLYNPGGLPPRRPTPAPPAGVVEHAFVAGTPKRVAEQIAALKQAGVRNLLLNVNVGQLPPAQVERSMRLFGAKVLPSFLLMRGTPRCRHPLCKPAPCCLRRCCTLSCKPRSCRNFL